MSKTVKNMIENELKRRLDGAESVAVFNPRGLDANRNNKMRRKFRAQGVRVVVVRNNLARRAVAGSKLAGFEKLLDGPSALMYGQTSVATLARLLLEEKKEFEPLELRGVYFDGELYEGEAGVETASKLPTREEAIAQVVSCILSAGSGLAGAMAAPAANIASILSTIEDRAKPAEGAAS